MYLNIKLLCNILSVVDHIILSVIFIFDVL